MCHEEFVPFAEHVGTISGNCVAEGFKSDGGGIDGGFGLLDRELGDGGDGFCGGGVSYFEGFASTGLDESAVYEGGFDEERGVFELRGRG